VSDIESRNSAKYSIENEPVLLCDLLPAVLAEIKKRYRIKFHIQLEPDQGNRRQRRSRESPAATHQGVRRQQLTRAVAGSSDDFAGLTKKKLL